MATTIHSEGTCELLIQLWTVNFACNLNFFHLYFWQGKLALLAWNGCFLSLPDGQSSTVYCSASKAGEREIIQVINIPMVQDSQLNGHVMIYTVNVSRVNF